MREQRSFAGLARVRLATDAPDDSGAQRRAVWRITSERVGPAQRKDDDEDWRFRRF